MKNTAQFRRKMLLVIRVCVLINSILGAVIFGSGVVAEEVQPQEGDLVF